MNNNMAYIHYENIGHIVLSDRRQVKYGYFCRGDNYFIIRKYLIYQLIYFIIIIYNKRLYIGGISIVYEHIQRAHF